MAEIILTPLLQVIFEKLANPVLQKFADYWELEERFKKLQRILPMAEAVIQDAETSSFVIGTESKLWKVLQKKKYLLVLDDIWNQDQEEWDKLRLLFSAGVDGSRVLVTTRCQKVAMLIDSSAAYHLKRLCEEDSWALFKKRAFFHQGEEENNQSLLAVGKEIVRKCDGVPLAAKVLGGLMSFKREERDWLHLQHSELWDIGVYRKGIFPAVILSYLHLPLHLKHCFAFCSILPKDYEVQREKLIHMWMAHGFILSDGGSRPLEDIGDEYFNELLWMSVFEKVNDCGGGSTRAYKMNKVFYSLARFITENELLVLEKRLGQRNFGQVRHASIVSYHGSSLVPEALHQAKHLRTLLVFSEGGIPSVPSHIFSSFVYLRTLNLSGCLVKLPESIGAISLLKYLDLSNSHFHELPSAISSLFSLEVLNLFACYNLKELPPMGQITGLSHLDISRCEALTEMPNGMKDLVHLQTLPIYIVPVNFWLMKRYNLLKKEHRRIVRKMPPSGSISDLKHLNLQGELKINCLERVLDVEEARAASLTNKKHLESLGLCWSPAGADRIMNPALQANAARFQERKPPVPRQKILNHQSPQHLIRAWLWKFWSASSHIKI
ncbi:putative disease resistance protein RGA3 [Sesamum alatum]|uniref:Disease resistance protein RGA3 n=1 Tax=Sesamum alatum TaxID=300844 RepID=A0AAE1YX64_9LAMI|nr:putative disease resistance protein RGA3 [Sesamum alatum]